LIWEVKTDDGSIHDKDDSYQWPNIQTDFIGKLNNDELGGFNDWRLPTVKELYSLVHNINIDSDEPIATEYFPNTKQTFYWSSTSYAIDTDDAWSLNFYNGSVVGYNKSEDYFVRAVRGGQSSTNSLVDNGDDTVTDTATGLMWQKLEVMNEGGTEVQRMTWEEALAYCEKLDLASYDDWRLPNAKELQSIADYEKAEPPCIDKIFWNAKPHPYWSSTITNSTGLVWIVVFKKGNVFVFDKYKTGYVRAVRGGK
jgi:hypothetical protein